MKAVITKTTHNKAIALKANGTFVYVPNKNYYVGQEIFVTDSKNTGIVKIARTVAAAAACFLLLSFGVVHAYSIPQSYVSIDINPSIEFEVNMFNHVINAKGVNSDGVTVLDKADISHKSMEKAIELIINQANVQGYINAESSDTLVVGIHCSNQEKEIKIIKSAKEQVNESLEYLSVSTTVAVNSVSQQTIQTAKNLGTTAGKLDFVQEYVEVTGDVTDTSQLVQAPLKQLNQSMNNANRSNIPNEPEDNESEDDNKDKNSQGNDVSDSHRQNNGHGKPDDDDEQIFDDQSNNQNDDELETNNSENDDYDDDELEGETNEFEPDEDGKSNGKSKINDEDDSEPWDENSDEQDDEEMDNDDD